LLSRASSAPGGLSRDEEDLPPHRHSADSLIADSLEMHNSPMRIPDRKSKPELRKLAIIGTTRECMESIGPLAKGGASTDSRVGELLTRLGADMSVDRQPSFLDLRRRLSGKYRPPVRFEDYELLGGGAFSTVWRVRCTSTNRLFALKVLNADVYDDQDLQSYAQRERRILEVSQHPFIIWLFACMRTPQGDLAFVMEYAPNGAVGLRVAQSVVEGRRIAILETVAAKWTSEVLLALKYLHALEIIHRDLKLDNILLDADDVAKLADFGLSRPTGTGLADSIVGTEYYMAPEIGKKDYGSTVDLYALGVCVFVMVTGGDPGQQYSGTHSKDQPSLFGTGSAIIPGTSAAASPISHIEYAGIVRREPPPTHGVLVSRLHDASWVGHLSEECTHFMRAACAEHPKSRGGAEALCAHPWTRKLTTKLSLRIGGSGRSLDGISVGFSVEALAQDSQILQSPLHALRSWTQEWQSRPEWTTGQR